MPPPAPPVRNATPQPSASPFNIPYSLIGSLHINAPTSSLDSLPRSRPVSRSGSPPSIHLSSRSGSPPSIRSARHPTLLTPGSNVSSLQSRTPSPGAGRQLQQLSFAGPAVSPALPAPPTPLTHSVLSPLMPSGVWMSPTGATNPMTACSSRSSSMDLFWDDITRYGNSRAPMGRKVSDNIEEGALSPVHSLSITEVGYVAFTQTVDVPSSEPEGAEESLESPAEDPGLWRGWEEEEAGIDGSDTETTVAALRRQLQDDEQDENEWNTITDMLLARLTSRAATMTSD
ncbi:hypothetical protein FRB98_002102 [Tulasnella sp. 332]|nr:hypothetical protein FRB98_002102 [Tulasnella sp. 332]